MPDYKDPKRTDTMITMGYSQEEIQDSLVNQKYNEVMATYLLLAYKTPELDDGSNATLKPRPGSDLTNSNVQSPSHKVQRSVSSNQKPRRPEPGERVISVWGGGEGWGQQGTAQRLVQSEASEAGASTAPQRVPVASPSAQNISSAAVTDRTNFPRGVASRSTFHAGQQRATRDQQGVAYNGPPASPSLSHGNSQARRGGGTGIFSKFTSKFVRR
ncbi:UNVERIFIED_CONTAM: hypothetical protein FKN15_038988 [Acipenser sinensis]